MKSSQDQDDIKSVVIATTDVEKALFIIAKDAMICDELEIDYTEKYAPTVEYILRIIRKAFGWLEIDRGVKPVVNTKCRFNQMGFCSHDKNLDERGLKKRQLKCSEAVRLNCKHYSQKYKDPMSVNYVQIEKAGQIRGM